ncbi:MAG: hypothetical protein HXS53_05065 [Theionarchaea archaeon]|nr:hypothetical protein [Theionarchaea archaeon]
MLEDVTSPGIAGRIREFYGPQAETIIENLEIEKLMEVPGLGKKTALSILRKAYELKTGEPFQDILSDDAQEVYEDILHLLQEYPCTIQGKNRFLVYYPVNNREILEKRLEYSREALEFVRNLSQEQLIQVLENLKKLKPLLQPAHKKFRDRVIVTDSVDVYTDVRNQYCDVLLIEDPSDLATLDQYPLAFYVYTGESPLYEFLLDKSDMQFFSDDFSIGMVIPELEIDQFIQNQHTIQVIWNIFESLGLKDDKLTEVKESLDLVNRRTDVIQVDIDGIVREVEKSLNTQFDTAMKEQLIELKGNDILSIMQQMQTDPLSALKRSIPDRVITLFDSLISEANKKVTDCIGMEAEVFSLELTYPIEADQNRVEELKDECRKTNALKGFNARRNVARIGQYWTYMVEKERQLHELDFKIALGRFFSDFAMNSPRFVESGLSFRNALNLMIPNPKPVHYKIGETPHEFATSDRIAVLTGANSGGKTTVLETILHLQILAQMGFYIPAEEFYCPLFEEILYLRKPKNQDAGAFESTLKKLIPLALSQTEKLVLIDELEAITEPGSAAKIIASFLNFLSQNKKTLCVLVTHLGKEISSLTQARIDGIEATGLNEQLELEVNRQPVFGKLGKSTPELIVEKLYRKSKNKEKDVYERILHDFKTL